MDPARGLADPESAPCNCDLPCHRGAARLCSGLGPTLRLSTADQRLKPYDYVIIGAGSAGCVLASRLGAVGHRVLLLEAGEDDRRLWIRIPIGYGKTYFDSRVNWCFHTEPEAGLAQRTSYWPRGKVVGGSSSINAMVYYRGLPHDFDDWAKAAGAEWSWPRVRGAFEAIERVQQADGNVSGGGTQWVTDPGDRYHPLGRHYLEAARDLGFSHNPTMIGGDGVGRYCITAHDGLRCSAVDAFLRPALKRYDIDVLHGVRVTRLLFDGARAVGAEFRLREGIHKIYCRREMIVSAGTVGSPQILQLSGIGPGSLLSRHRIMPRVELPAVGGNLQDHLAVTYFFKSRLPTLNNQLHPWWGKAWAGLRYVVARQGPLALGVNQYGGFVRSTDDAPRADMQLYFNPITYSKTPVGKRPLLSPDAYPGYILSFQPCRPVSRGRIDIASDDPLAAPKIRPNYLGANEDVEAVIRGARLLARFADSEALRAITLEPVGPTPTTMNDEQLVADFRERADTVFHPVGTCAMGTDPRNSVVDSRLRVHGVEALRVVDASVFPNVTSGNTNAPTLMTAWRGADMIIADDIAPRVRD
jgi:choline dehydrogenase